MTLNLYLVVLTFVVIMVVIYLAKDFTSAVLTISLLANFLIICSQLSSISLPDIIGTSDKIGRLEDDTPIPSADVPDDSLPDAHMYGAGYDRYHINHMGYTDAYAEPQPVTAMSASEQVQGVDAANALIAQRRARDKKCMDGWASKNSDYYRHHFNDELDRAEASQWWGQAEV